MDFLNISLILTQRSLFYAKLCESRGPTTVDFDIPIIYNLLTKHMIIHLKILYPS